MYSTSVVESATHVESVTGLGQVGLGQPRSVTWITSRVDMMDVYYYYLVKLARCGTPVPQPLPI